MQRPACPPRAPCAPPRPAPCRSRTVSRNSRITFVAGVRGEQLDQLRHAEIGLVADRDQLGEAQAARGAAREHRAEHGAALRHDARRSRGQRVRLEHRVHGEREAPGHVDHAHAVRARARARRAALRARPASPGRAIPPAPASAKPSLKMVATGTPRAPHSSIARSTDSPGVMMKAWSISPGASARSGTGALAQNLRARGVDRNDAPRVAVLAAGSAADARCSSPRRPTRRSSATARGANNACASVTRAARVRASTAWRGACAPCPRRSPANGELQVLRARARASESGRSGSPLRVGCKCSLAPPVARLDGDARRALRRKSGVELRDRARARLRRISARVAASCSRAGSNAARRTLPCVSAVATRYGVLKSAPRPRVAGSAIPATSRSRDSRRRALRAISAGGHAHAVLQGERAVDRGEGVAAAGVVLEGHAADVEVLAQRGKARSQSGPFAHRPADSPPRLP